MKFVNVKELKDKLSEYLRIIETEDIVVTYRGKPKALLRHFTEDGMEDYVLANHPEIRASIEQAYQEFLEGKVTDLDSIIRETEEEIENANI